MNTQRGDTGTEVVIKNADGSKTMHMLRLKVQNGAITEIETIKANQGEADRLWGPDNLTAVSRVPALDPRARARFLLRLDRGGRQLLARVPNERHAELWPSALLPDSRRFENGVQTTGVVRDGQFQTTQSGFDNGRFLGRNLWDRRYTVVDEERGVVLSIVRFGLKAGAKSQNVATANDRLVAEFFAIKAGYIQEIQAVLFNLPDDKPTGWPAGYGPGRASAE